MMGEEVWDRCEVVEMEGNVSVKIKKIKRRKESMN